MTALSGLISDRQQGISLNMILLSLLLHAIILSIIFFVTPRASTPKWTFGPVYSVQLVNLPAKFFNQKPEPAAKEVVETPTEREPVVLKKEDDTTPLKKKPKLDKETQKALDDIKKRLTVTSKSKSSDRAQSRYNIGALSSIGNKDMLDRMQLYYALIWSRIKSQWALPPGIKPEDNRETTISMQILRNGMLVDAKYEKRSGNKYFDESAMKAIRKASPFPHLPEWIKDNSIEIGIRFHSSDLK
jgi:colicin import membrane protein